jgi:hypothetical protein
MSRPIADVQDVVSQRPVRIRPLLFRDSIYVSEPPSGGLLSRGSYRKERDLMVRRTFISLTLIA